MIRKIARPMLASVFVWDAVDTLRNTTEHVAETESVLSGLRKVLPAPYSDYVPADPELVARGLASAKVASGSLFALGKAPRTSAAVLALTHLPSLFGNAFWNADNEADKKDKRTGFVTDTALIGALAILTQDTEGNPSLRWRAQKASERTAKKVQAALPTKSESEKLADNVSGRAAEFSAQAQDWLTETTGRAQAYVEDNREDWEATGRGLLATAKSYVEDAREAVESYVEDNRGDWEDKGKAFLAAARENSETARKRVVKNAARAQDRADAARARFASFDAEVASAQSDKARAAAADAAERAAAQAEKLQKYADKRIAKALKKFEDRI